MSSSSSQSRCECITGEITNKLCDAVIAPAAAAATSYLAVVLATADCVTDYLSQLHKYAPPH